MGLAWAKANWERHLENGMRESPRLLRAAADYLARHGVA